ncbi:MAG: glutathione S-transferase [Sphingomicrobium sp.]
MALTLINAGPSPFGRKVAIALLEKGLDFDTVLDTPWAAETITTRHNPLEQLPILIAGDETLFDSVYILEWIETRHPEPALVPVEADARLAVRKRQLLGERVMEIAQTLIMELHRPEPGADWVDRQTRKINGGLSALDELYVARGTPGSAIDVGDIAVATTLLLFEHAVSAGYSPDITALRWRGRYPALTRLVESVEQRPSFVATRPQEMALDLAATVG